MPQNIYDNEEFFVGYSRLNRSVHGLDGTLEWPALRAMLPDIRGATVLDLLGRGKANSPSPIFGEGGFIQ